MAKVKILITLEGGVIQVITSTSDVEVKILNLDDKDLVNFSPDCGKELYEAVLEEAKKTAKEEEEEE